LKSGGYRRINDFGLELQSAELESVGSELITFGVDAKGTQFGSA
jgi:hypothetical protein